MKEPVQQSLWPFNFLATSHIRVPSRALNPHSPLTPHTVNMGKVPQMTRQGTRYEPYKNSSRRRASPPPDTWGIHAGSRHAQFNGSIFDLLEALNTRYGSHDLRELFRDHANQPGALGQAIETWIQYDEVIIFLTSSFVWAAQTAVLLAHSLFQIRGPRQPEPTDFPGTQHRGELSPPLALSGSPGGLFFISPHCSPNGSTGDEAPGLQTSPGQRYPTSNTRPHTTDSPPLSLLQLMRGVEAPPLFSMPPLVPSAVHDRYALSNLTVTLEGLMLRYQVGGVSRQWP